jgi:hypothetical protein
MFMIWRSFLSLCLVLLGTIVIAGCGRGGTDTPASAPATTEPTETPVATPTAAPTVTPTATPTEAPTAAPTETPRPQAQVYFEWAAGGVRPADSDDVDGIVLDLLGREGIVDGFGNEIGITIKYDPTLIEVEELQDVFKSIGHPVEVVEK